MSAKHKANGQSKQISPEEVARLLQEARQASGNGSRLPKEVPEWTKIFWLLEWHGDSPQNLSVAGIAVTAIKATEWLYGPNQSLIGQCILLPSKEVQAHRLIVCCMGK